MGHLRAWPVIVVPGLPAPSCTKARPGLWNKTSKYRRGPVLYWPTQARIMKEKISMAKTMSWASFGQAQSGPSGSRPNRKVRGLAT